METVSEAVGEEDKLGFMGISVRKNNDLNSLPLGEGGPLAVDEVN
jgi:hypothetical protein